MPLFSQIIYLMKLKKAVEILENQSISLITLKKGDEISIKSIDEVFLARVENNQVIAYDKNENYISNKRLYELEKILDKIFSVFLNQ